MNDGEHKAVALLRDSKSPLRTAEFVAAGINRMALSRLTAEGRIERVGNGLYRLPEFSDVHSDWAAITVRYPSAVIATLSAASFHHTTQEVPSRIYVAMPRKSGHSTLAATLTVDTQVLRMTDAHNPADDPLSFGVEEHPIDGIAVKITNPERTLVDMFRYSPFNPGMPAGAIHVSEEAFLECLQRTLTMKEFSTERLDEYIRRAGVARHMGPILKNALYNLTSVPFEHLRASDI